MSKPAPGFPKPDWAIVLGSGLGGCCAHWPLVQSLNFQEAGLTAPGVQGHAGKLDWREGPQGKIALFASGRFHSYEGHGSGRVFQLVDFFGSIKAEKCLLTCATGGIRRDLRPGTLVAVSKSVLFNQILPWDRLQGISLTDLGQWPGPVPHPELFSLVLRALELAGLPAIPGVHAQMTGPSYETPAEVRMLSRLGVTAVGMSTGLELNRANQIHLPTGAIAVVANLAAGLSLEKITHQEVLESMANARASLEKVLHHLVFETKSFQEDQ